MTKTVLLTGFEPFGGFTSNPSQIIAQQLDGGTIAGHTVIGATLACEFGRSIRQLKKLIKEHEPSLVICLGLAGGRTGITPERIAINIDDARIPDNAGVQRKGTPVVRNGPVGYWSTLPIKAITATLLKNDIPASVSQTAGTFVCNHVFYGLMHELVNHPKTRGGFIHIPFLAGTSEEPSLPLDLILEGIRIAIATSLKVRRDVDHPDGTTH